jgi:hypothetical protein
MQKRTIEKEQYIVEQIQLDNGIWIPIHRYNKRTDKKEL